MTVAWHCDLTGNEKLVLLALADSANDAGVCWPSIPNLCLKTRASERTIQGILKSLKEGGHISWADRPGKGRLYTVHPRKSCTPAESAPPQKLPDTPAEVAGNTSRNTNTPLTPQPHAKRSRPRLATSAPPPEPIVTQMPAEGFEATKFREMAALALGDGAYRNLIQPCSIARVADDLLLQAPTETLADIIRGRGTDLGPIARQIGCVRLLVDARPLSRRGAPDSKVDDALRQLNAIRGGREARTAAQAGGRR